jgi:MFS superfamily sulfate permease-like transporter
MKLLDWPRPLAGLRGITLADVPREAMAGVTLAALMIPLNIGYAQVAGLPPTAGLYAAIVPLVVFALLASSRHLVTSPDASKATVVVLTLTVACSDLARKGVGVLGAIPSGLPTLTLPAIPAADYLKLFPGVMAIVAILLCEGLLVVRSYSSKYGYKADGDQMLFAYGAANLAAGFTGSLLTGNSPHARRRWTPGERRASCRAWWRRGRSRW